ncbi:MAG: flotillin family protein [Clostridiaceae bacterium]|jgi:flotillin|nr:flotillin family protein [Clostridiaceae bacterium]
MNVGAIIGIILGSIAFLLILVVVLSYKKAPPDTAFIITGFRKKRILIGKSALQIPFFERLDKVPLNLMKVDIKTSSPVPTNEFININVDGVANVKISTDPEMLERAAQIFLKESIEGMTKIVKEVLDGNMREIIGQMRLTDLVHNRDEFASKVSESASKDMKRMGLEIVNFTIQNFSDRDGVIENLGIDKVSVIRKDAQIAKANADRDVAIATSKAKEEANKARVDADTKIVEQNVNLDLKKSELKIQTDTQMANADAAYDIQRQTKQLDINTAAVDAEIAKKEREVALRIQEVSIQEKTLEATIKKKADADKYAQEKYAEAELFKRSKASEARKYEEQQQAEILKINAEAARYKVEQEALAIQKQAEAQRIAREQEAAGILAVGNAEAEAIEKRAEAQKKMGDASVLELLLNSNVLPQVVEAMARPMSSALAQIDSITMYGEGNSAKLTEDITTSQVKLFKGIQDATGIDVKSVLAGITGLLGGKMLADKSEKDGR